MSDPARRLFASQSLCDADSAIDGNPAAIAGSALGDAEGGAGS